MVHEALAYAAFRAAGVPAPRTGYADVRVNGRGVRRPPPTWKRSDDVALQRLFGPFEEPPQHLYEGAPLRGRRHPRDAGEFEVDEGEEGDRSRPGSADRSGGRDLRPSVRRPGSPGLPTSKR